MKQFLSRWLALIFTTLILHRVYLSHTQVTISLLCPEHFIELFWVFLQCTVGSLVELNFYWWKLHKNYWPRSCHHVWVLLLSHYWHNLLFLHYCAFLWSKSQVVGSDFLSQPVVSPSQCWGRAETNCLISALWKATRHSGVSPQKKRGRKQECLRSLAEEGRAKQPWFADAGIVQKTWITFSGTWNFALSASVSLQKRWTAVGFTLY